MFEMLAGYRPYRRYEHNPSLLDNAIRRQEPRESLPPQAEAALVAIVHKLLAPQRERRYQHAAAIASDLEAFLRGAPTMAGLEHAQASQETVRLAPRTSVPPAAAGPAVRPATAQTAATEPLIRHAPPPPVPSDGPSSQHAQKAQEPPRSAASWRPPLFVRVMRAALVALLIGAIAAEGVSVIRGQRLRRQVPAIDVGDLGRVRTEYARTGSWSVLGLGQLRAAGPLVDRLVQLADRTIIEYRGERPALGQRQWEGARDALEFAYTLAPGNMNVAARRAYVRGQLARIDGRDREAIRLFRDAANLAPKSMDPYLGLATVYAYGTHDLTGLTDAIDEAERRGYKPGRRERAELGDLHKTLADEQRAEARKVSGPERIEHLQRAAADYVKCIEYFDGLRLFNSEANLGVCRRRLAEVQAQLPAPSLAAPFTGTEL
jgi:tetratricopeptide (TPR) repeat protein